MNKQIYFGEIVDGYEVRVLNEREARAGAGILFLFGFTSFMHAYLLHEFIFTQIFVTVFMFDFIIRIFINPKYSPSLLLGRVMVQNQIPEYVGAPQKRWAWFIGLFLSITMFLIIVVFGIITQIKIAICFLCLFFLYFESVFGICVGCKLYNFIYKEQPKLCPGGVCEIRQKDEIQKFSKIQKIIVIVFVIVVSMVVYKLAFSAKIESERNTQKNISKCGANKCGGK